MGIEKVRVRLKKTADSSYDAHVGKGSLDLVAGFVSKLSPSKCCVITDDNVFRLHGERVLSDLRNAGLDAVLLSFPAGEKSKNVSTYARLCSQALDAGVDRKSAVIALGGGVVGDLAGFVASTYMRGIPFVQVPTTLLAMVDSSIGGKVGVDLPAEKNSIGCFWQPKATFADTSLLHTLPKHEMQNGFAEAVKTACIADPKLFDFLEKNFEKILAADEETAAKAVKRCCEIKAAVVERDEREAEYRKILNFGHTLGHSVETLGGYKLSHGHCVSIGMCAATRISSLMRLLPQKEVERVDLLLQKAGLPTTLPKGLSPDAVYEHARFDKKNTGGRVQFVLLEKIGKAAQKKGKIGIEVDRRFALQALAEISRK
ncbi:MAG: 3-dehydroquinate synthase [Candidatus Micrarchaeia archaeon]